MNFAYFAICVFLLYIVAQITRVECHPKNYKEILASLKYKDRLLFDITKPVEEGLQHDNTSDFSDWDGLKKLAIQLSPILYHKRVYNRNGTIYDHPQPTYRFMGDDMKAYPPFISFIFGLESANERLNMTYPLTSDAISTFLKSSTTSREFHFTVIFPGSKYEVPRHCKLEISVFKRKYRNVKIGVELSDRMDIVTRKLNLVDLVVLNIDIPLEKFLLTYPKFKAHLRKTLDVDISYVRRFNSHCIFYAKLNLGSGGGADTQLKLSSALYKKYYFYLLLYSVFWLNEIENERIILHPFSLASALEDGLPGAKLRDIISARLFLDLNIVKSRTCEMKAVVDHVSPNIKSISIGTMRKYHFQNVDSRIFAKCAYCKGHPLEKRPAVNASSSPPFITEEEIGPSFMREAVDFVRKDHSILHGLQVRQIEYHLLKKKSTDPSIERMRRKEYTNIGPPFTTILSKFRGPFAGMTFACNVETFGVPSDAVPNDGNFVESVRTSCNYIWNESDYSVWSFDFSGELDLGSLTSKLLEIELDRQQFVQQYPSKYVKLKIHLAPKHAVINQPDQTFSLYCRQEVAELNEKAEVVINFARIHNILLDIKPVLDPEGTIEWWSLIHTVDELDVAKTGFPVLTSRNYPEHFLAGDFKTDPCISWASSVPTEGLVMDPEYAGTTLYMKRLNSSRLGKNELGTLLLVVLHKFSLVEVVPEVVSDLFTVLTTLSSQEFANSLAEQESKQAVLYLRVDCNFLITNKFTYSHFNNQLEKLALALAGIHWDNLENCSNINDSYLENLSENTTMQGILLEDCVNEVNANFLNLRKFKQFGGIQYLLCNIKHSQETSNRDKFAMEKYLDTTLYVTKYFQRIFPDENKEILFRLNPIPFTPGFDSSGDEMLKMTEFLKFFSDVSEYARVYKIKLFMIPAFDDEQGIRDGWWKILNHERLSNTSVFIEKESEYHGRDSWRPSSTVKVGRNWTPVAYIALGIIIALLLALIMFLRVQYQRRFALLSRKEVGDFKYGTYKYDDSRKDQAVVNIKFPKEFEIPRNRFVLLNTIGSGNFGLVYNAALTTDGGDSLPVAVKMPKPNFPKGTFKTMLSELKVLCYVGSHPHVLEFVGAYVKEIGKGITYIATELCENGSLLEYLRKMKLELPNGNGINHNYVNVMKSNPEENEVISKPLFYDLCRFSHEIALGMEYISFKKIVHGDLSTRNVLLNSELSCKIGDFGLSRKLYEYQEYIKKNSEPLTWRWLAIESLKRMEFTTKTDVWSYGLMDFEFDEIISYAGSIPYPGLSWTVSFVDELENGLRMDALKFSSSEINEKMANCWDQNPEDRPTFTELAQVFRMSRDAHYTEVMDTSKSDHSNDDQGNFCETSFTLNHP